MIAGLLVGMAFGFVLGWSRLTDYDVIRNMLLLRDFDVFLMMGSAVVTAAIASRILRAAGARSLVGGSRISWSVFRPTRDHVYGSVLFGVGWAISGTCPGPVAAQLGRGQLAALFTLAGILPEWRYAGISSAVPRGQGSRRANSNSPGWRRAYEGWAVCSRMERLSAPACRARYRESRGST